MTLSGINQDTLVQLEISVQKLEALFDKGELCAADIHCLNCQSKTCIWNLCLNSCAKRMHCDKALYKECIPCGQSLQNSKNSQALIVGVKPELFSCMFK